MRKISAFYAWQSDTPSKLNRNLIEHALRTAAERITADPSMDAELQIDSDTQGVPGTPPITETILGKIKECDIFMPDVSFVATTSDGKRIPNPNVMVEFGYALHSRTHAAIVPLMNTAFGLPSDLPFDLSHLRHPIQYKVDLTMTDTERRSERETLSKKIEERLRSQIAATQTPPPPPQPFIGVVAKDGHARFRARGTPIAKRWDTLRFGLSAENAISLKSGSAMWLRLVPSIDPGRTFPAYELKQHGLETGEMKLAPFFYSNIYFLRAEDGFGICTLASHDDSETSSVAFAFETGEIWSIDTFLLGYDPTKLFIGEIEKQFSDRLKDYSRFLAALEISPPYRWIAGIEGVDGRRLEVPIRPGHMQIPGWLGEECRKKEIEREGAYDGAQSPVSALMPFFMAVYDACGTRRPDYLPQS